MNTQNTISKATTAQIEWPAPTKKQWKAATAGFSAERCAAVSMDFEILKLAAEGEIEAARVAISQAEIGGASWQSGGLF